MTPQEEIQVRQMIANQMSAPRQPMFRAQMPDMDPTPRMTMPTPEAERDEYLRQRQALENAARFRGLLGNTPNPYARGLRPPTDAERARLDANSQVNPEMPLNDLARARLEAERAAMDGSRPMLPPGSDVRSPPPINPYPPGFDVPPMLPPGPGYGRFPAPTPTPPPDYRIRPPAASPEYNIYNKEKYAQAKAAWFANPRNEGRIYKEEYAFNDPGEPNTIFLPDQERLRESDGQADLREMAADPEPEEYDGFVDSGTGKRGYLDFKYMPSPPPISGGGVAAAPEPEEYDGFVNSGTGQRGYLDFKYMPTPMAQAAPPVANTAYNAPPVASTAYMPPPTAAPVNTAYMPPPTDAPINTAYMPSRRTVPVDTTYRPPASANTTYMPSPSPTYGMSTTPTYSMSNAQTTTPTYGGQIREPSYSPNQAGKYKVDSPRLKNTGGLFNDLNAFFGRPQT